MQGCIRDLGSLSNGPTGIRRAPISFSVVSQLL